MGPCLFGVRLCSCLFVPESMCSYGFFALRLCVLLCLCSERSVTLCVLAFFVLESVCSYGFFWAQIVFFCVFVLRCHVFLSFCSAVNVFLCFFCSQVMCSFVFLCSFYEGSVRFCSCLFCSGYCVLVSFCSDVNVFFSCACFFPHKLIISVSGNCFCVFL